MTQLCSPSVRPSDTADEFSMMFNGDRLLVDQLRRYHDRHGFASALETGTHKAETTRGLARLFSKVWTVEVDINYFLQSRAALAGCPHVTLRLGNSPDAIRSLLPEFRYPLFAFLDAHWYEYWPLRDELSLLMAVKRPKLIMIHDFQVPGREFGFDSYLGRPNSLDFIGDLLPHDECRYAFNHRTAAGSANRGVLFIEHLLD